MAEYIEREAVLKCICSGCFEGDMKGNGFCGLPCDDYQRISKLPAADVAPIRHGKWVGHDIGGGISIDNDACSECGSVFYQIAETGCVWNFCPNCGADMREES